MSEGPVPPCASRSVQPVTIAGSRAMSTKPRMTAAASSTRKTATTGTTTGTGTAMMTASVKPIKNTPPSTRRRAIVMATS